MPPALRIQKNIEDKFEAVDFVHGKTPHQLKVIIRGLWNNIQEIATELDESHPEVALILDNLLDGKKINTNTLKDRYQYFQFADAILELDVKNNKMKCLDRNGHQVGKSVNGIELKYLKTTIKTFPKEYQPE